MLKVQTFIIGPIETNCYLAYDESTKEAILIDPAVFNKEIQNFIKDHNIKVRFTVNTHGHYDHIGGNKEFGYPVLIHEEDEECFKDPVRSLILIAGGSTLLPKAHRVLKDGDTIQIKNFSFKVIHLPGHSPGGIGLKCDKVLFTGDTLFFEGVGRTDLPFADNKVLANSLKKLMRYSDDTIVYPGHGPQTTIGHERKGNPFLCENG